MKKQTFILFLRGINVGGKNIVPMQELTQLLETLGCTHVKTYIQSGNIAFQSSASSSEELSSEIQPALTEKFAFAPDFLLLTQNDFSQAIENNPFSSQTGKDLHFFFIKEKPPAPDLDLLHSLKTGAEDFRLIEKVFYLWAPEGVGRSKLAAKVEKALGQSATARNWNTVSKVRELFTAQ